MAPGETWTKERDFALAFGTALGLSAAQIAKSMGDVSRNAVIGRWHRTKMNVPGKYHPPRLVAPRHPVKRHLSEEQKEKLREAIKMARESKGSLWSEEEDKILADCVDVGMTIAEIRPFLPDRTDSAIHARKNTKGLRKAKLRRFTPEDDAIIREDYLNHVDTIETARKLNRSNGVIRQRIFALRLSRDGRKTKLAQKWGHDVLGLSDDPSEIQRIMAERTAAEKAQRDAEHKAKVERALDAMDKALADGVDRKLAYQAAMMGGATLQAIGTREGITRERVRQVVSDVKAKPSPNTNCIGCGEPFVREFGQQKYCSPGCRASHYSNNKVAPHDPINCAHCGDPFVPAHGRAKFCGPNCSYRHQQKVAKEKRDQAKAALVAVKANPEAWFFPEAKMAKPAPKPKQKRKPKPQPYSLRRSFLR